MPITPFTLTRNFLDDLDLHRTISARRVVYEALSVVKRQDACEAEDVAADLALVTKPRAGAAR